MNDTPALTLSQVFDLMDATMRIQGSTLAENLDVVPEAQYNEICRLGSAMWKQVQSIRMAADPNFQAFKAGLLAKPKRTRKSRGVSA